MASSDLKFKRTIVDRVSIKGTLSGDGTEIIYWDENKEEQVISIMDLVNAFKDEPIEMTVSLRMEEDLDIIPDDEDLE